MFGFAKTQQKDVLGDVKSAERWLASFARVEPLAFHAELVAELDRIANADPRRTPNGLEALFRVDAAANELRSTLTAQYLEHAGRSGKIEQQLWQSLYDLAHAFLSAYAAYARTLADHTHDERWNGMRAELVVRQLAHMTLDAKVRMFRCEQWIPAKWSALHELFGQACGRRIERQAIDLREGKEPVTIEQKYVETLVLQLMNTGNLKPVHVEWLARQLEQWCVPLRVTLEPPSAISFYVDLTQRHGLRRRTPDPLRGRVLFVDTSPILSLLQHYVLALEGRIKSQPLSQRSLKRVEQMALVSKLAAQVDPQFRPIARRGERVRASGNTEAVVGFANITASMREDDRVPSSELDTKATFGDTLELAVFGRRRGMDAPLARRRLSAYGAAGGMWDLKDISDTGLRIEAANPTQNGLGVGTLVLVRPDGQLVWTLTVLRRMKRLSAERAEVGLQVIADSAVLVDLVPEGNAGVAAYSVNGEAIAPGARAVRALFLLMRRRGEGSAVQSVIVRGSDYQSGKRYTVRTRKSSYGVRFGRLMERQHDWTWVVVEPIMLGPEEAKVSLATPG